MIHLGAEGDDFCAGADLEAMERDLDAGSDVHRQEAEAIGRVLLALRALMKPVVCTVRGRALAVGAGLATACDMILAPEQGGLPAVFARQRPDASVDHHLLNVWTFNVDTLRLSGYMNKDRGGKIKMDADPKGRPGEQGRGEGRDGPGQDGATQQ